MLFTVVVDDLVRSRSYRPRPLRATLEERLLARREVDQESGCWLWCGPCNDRGYGRLSIANRTVSAHRAAASVWLGFDLKSRAFVLHGCDNPPCFNPDHLWIGSQRENVADRDAKGRRAAPNGAKNGRAVLSEEDVVEIRRRAADGERHEDLATQFAVSRSTVGHVCRARTWSYLGLPPIQSRKPNAKLTPALAAKVRAQISDGRKQVDIAEQFGITQSTVSKIARGVLWQDLKT